MDFYQSIVEFVGIVPRTIVGSFQYFEGISQVIPFSKTTVKPGLGSLWEIEHGQYVCAEPMSGEAVEGMAATHSDLCMNPRAKKFYNLYIEHMDDAELLSDKTEEAGLIDKFSGYMIRPMALIGALIWLI